MEMSHKLAIVMPAYNEGEVIADVVEKWTGLLKRAFNDSDNPILIVVNDGSKDNTGETLIQLAKTNPLLIAVNQPNGGHGNAVVNAYKKALELNAEYVFQTDSDDQFETEDFLSFGKNATTPILYWAIAKHVLMRLSDSSSPEF